MTIAAGDLQRWDGGLRMTTRRANPHAVYSCRASRHRCVRTRDPATLAEVVADYREFHSPIAKDEIDFYRSLPHAEAVAWAARAKRPDGKRHDHQRRISKKAIERVEKALANADFRGVRTFAKLYEELTALVSKIKGIGPLFVYDAAVRIGANRRLAPKTVYVHAGVKKGVRAVIRGNLRAMVLPNEFPAPLSRCTAAELEDLLCIFGGMLLKSRRRLGLG